MHTTTERVQLAPVACPPECFIRAADAVACHTRQPVTMKQLGTGRQTVFFLGAPLYQPCNYRTQFRITWMIREHLDTMLMLLTTWKPSSADHGVFWRHDDLTVRHELH